MSGGTTYYAKRCWGYAPVEEDGSAYFEAPAGKELYFQVCDAEGRELRRMTSGTQLMAGEMQGCIGCHESRDTTQPNRFHSLALRRRPSPLRLPEWGNAGVIDYVRVIQPILDRHCVRCHSGTAPDGGVLLERRITRGSSTCRTTISSCAANRPRSRPTCISVSPAICRWCNSTTCFPGSMQPSRPLTTGSLVSRLPELLRAYPLRIRGLGGAEMRRLYEWIDAMAPYYTTYFSARPGSRGDRDRWGDNREAQKIADWYAQGFAAGLPAALRVVPRPDRTARAVRVGRQVELDRFESAGVEPGADRAPGQVGGRARDDGDRISASCSRRAGPSAAAGSSNAGPPFKTTTEPCGPRMDAGQKVELFPRHAATPTTRPCCRRSARDKQLIERTARGRHAGLHESFGPHVLRRR